MLPYSHKEYGDFQRDGRNQMSVQQIKMLESLKEKRKEIQEKEDKIKAELLKDLSTYLIKAEALNVDFDILIGGILDVIEKANQGDAITEAWKTSGQKFCQRHRPKTPSKNPSTPKEPKEDKSNGEQK